MRASRRAARLGGAGALTVIGWFSLASAGQIPTDAQLMKNPIPVSETVLGTATGIYEENCRQCHGLSGRGDGPMSGMLKEKPADLTNPAKLSLRTDGEIFWVLTKGVDPMPPFDEKLTDEERWGLVHLMRKFSDTKPNNTPRKRF